MRSMAVAFIPEGGVVLDQSGNSRGREQWPNSGHIWNGKAQRMSCLICKEPREGKGQG